MKKFVAFFIRYPIAVNTLMASLAFFGYLALKSINSTFFPIVPSRFILVQAVYPGASPEEIEEGIVQKVEENLKGISGVERISSVSAENAATVTIEVLKNYDADLALEDVKNAVNSIPSFPVGMEPIRVFKRENINFTIRFSLDGPNVPLKTLKEMARKVEADLQQTEGISKVELLGFPEEEIEISLNEQSLRTYGIGFEQIANALRAENLEISGGFIKGRIDELPIRARNKGYFARDLENILVFTSPEGRILRLKDVAEIRDRFTDAPGKARVNNRPAALIVVNNTDSEDMLSAAEKVRKYIDDFNIKNTSVQARVLQDASVTLEQRKQLLIENGIMGFFLVLVLLALFLNLRVAFWVAAGIPVSFLGMFILGVFGGITINVISLFGMIVVVGILVDDGIVISENIYQHFERGKSPIRAALDGTFEVLPAVLSAVLTTIVAFSTFFFLDGRAGDFFSEMSFIVMATLAVSMVEAILFLPSHLAHSRALLNPQRNKLERSMDAFMDFMRFKMYAPALRFLLAHRFLGLMIPVALLIITLGAFKGQVIKGTFFPFIERDNVEIGINMPTGTREEVTWEKLDYIYQKALEVNAAYNAQRTDSLSLMQDVSMQVGPLGHQGTLNINLLDAERRGTKSYEVANKIREAVGFIPGADNLTYGNASAFGRPVSISLLSNNNLQLEAAKEALKAYMKSLTQIEDITDSDIEGPREVQIHLKPKAELLGFTTRSLMSQVRQGFFGLEVQRIQRGQDEIKVWLRYNDENRATIFNLQDIRLKSPQGELIPLKELADIEIARGRINISHLDGKREVKVEAELSNPAESAPAIIDDIRENYINAILLPQYPEVSALYEGQNREAMKTAGSAQKVLPFIFITMILIITFTFRSLFQTLVVFLLIPLTLTGVAWGHFFHGMPLSIFSYLGVIALIGILVNDSLVFVSKFNSLLKEGLSLQDAIYQAGISRFRAIFLTSATTIAGLAPLILERSFQAQFLVPMAISVAYGIAYATLLTLTTLPILLTYLNSFRRFYLWLISGILPQAETVEPAIAELKDEHDEL